MYVYVYVFSIENRLKDVPPTFLKYYRPNQILKETTEKTKERRRQSKRQKRKRKKKRWRRKKTKRRKTKKMKTQTKKRN